RIRRTRPLTLCPTRRSSDLNQPVAIRATARAGYTEAGLNELKVPDATLDDLRQRGFAPAAGGLDADVAAVPLRLELENGEEFWLGFDNFYVITRYNHSYRYAMAVYQLSELIRVGMGREAS